MKDAGRIALIVVLAAVSVFLVSQEAPAAPTEAEGVHRAGGTLRCMDCHFWLPLGGIKPSFRDETEPICSGCHKEAHGKGRGLSHSMSMVPSMAVPRDMPLDSKGRITCVTCHKFHAGYKDSDGKRLYFLRRTSGKAFCYSCHRKRLF